MSTQPQAYGGAGAFQQDSKNCTYHKGTPSEDPFSRQHGLPPKSEPRKMWEKPGCQLESEHLTGHLVSYIYVMVLQNEVCQSICFHIFNWGRIPTTSLSSVLFFHLSFILFLALYGLLFQLLTIITYNPNPSLSAHIITPLFGNLHSYPLNPSLSLYFLIQFVAVVPNVPGC